MTTITPPRKDDPIFLQRSMRTAASGRNIETNRLENQLLESYFASEDPAWLIVNREMFEKDRKRVSVNTANKGHHENSFYSELLKSAM